MEMQRKAVAELLRYVGDVLYQRYFCFHEVGGFGYRVEVREDVVEGAFRNAGWLVIVSNVVGVAVMLCGFIVLRMWLRRGFWVLSMVWMLVGCVFMGMRLCRIRFLLGLLFCFCCLMFIMLCWFLVFIGSGL